MSNATLQVGGGNWAAQDGKLLGYAVEPTSGRYLAREFTVNRNSSKWVLGSDGYLYEVPADQPALEYYSDGTFRGALVEPESTNEALNSEAINSWNKQSGANVENNVETAPNNTQTADRVYGVSGDTYVFIRQTFTFSGVTSGDFVATFSTATGQIATNDSEITNTKAISLANGWYRISATLENKYTTSLFVKKDREGSIGIRYQTNQNRIVIQFSGSPEPSVYVWGIQLEQSPVATSYIPTTTGAVTRLKDDISFTNASSVIGQSEGTLFVEVDWQYSGANQFIFAVSDGVPDNRVQLTADNANGLRYFIEADGSSAFSLVESGASGFTGIQKIIAAYKPGDSKLFRNGSEKASDSDVLSNLGSMDIVSFGQNWSATGQANMWIRDARIYNTRLTDTQCQDLTDVESFNTEYLVVAGGGGGGNSQISNFPRAGGGGGAGGVLQGNISLTSSELFTVTVGDGGNGSTGDAVAGQSGENSVFASLTAIGGGGGGGSNADNAKNGGSGGGGGESQPAGTGTVGQGNNGGSGASDGGGGGGGAGSVGDNGTEDNGGNGGSGIESTITGASVYYAGGGGGGGTSSGGNGGIGGGGNGGANANGSNATANTGGGGGGTGDATSSHYDGGNGGSGIVVIKYPSSLSVKYGTGLTFNTQTSGDYKITTFTSGTGKIAIQ